MRAPRVRLSLVTILLVAPVALPSQSAPAALAVDTGSSHLPTAAPQRNVASSGVLRNGVLTLRLVVQRVRWHPEADDGPSVAVDAFGVEGGTLSVPGPLIRVKAGTRIEASIRNGLADTLLVYGLSGLGGVDTVRIAPGAIGHARRMAGTAGTYAYGAATIVGDSVLMHGTGNQLLGALVVDGSTARRDRIFVASTWPLAPGRFIMAINGKSWPHTERLDVRLGDSVHWRIINGTQGRHPFHLHGFYFRIDARGSWAAETLLTGDRPHVVTESVPTRSAFSMTWIAERPGNWLFHCHDAMHTTWRQRYQLIGQRPPPTPPVHDAAHHMELDMAGLVLGIRVRGRESALAASRGAVQRRAWVTANQRPSPNPNTPVLSYAVAGAGQPARDSLDVGIPLVLTLGERSEITVVNRLSMPTAVHWHGIELDSYYDGVAGWSGTGVAGELRAAPIIAPNDSFVVRITPPRAGTFIYHAHADDIRQIALGLYGALVVLPAGEQWRPETDHVLLFSQLGRGQSALLGMNGSARPGPIALTAGVRHRFRIINITVTDDVQIALLSADSSHSWRPLAKDGADLSRAQSTMRPARVLTAPGETYDFEVELPAGDHRLRVNSFGFNDFDVELTVR